MFVPALLVRQATEDLVGSALRDAPVRPSLPPARSRLGTPVERGLRRRRPVAVPPAAPLLQHVEWHVARDASAHALHRWTSATSVERASAFFAYRAALDREEAAARELRRVTVGAPT